MEHKNVYNVFIQLLQSRYCNLNLAYNFIYLFLYFVHSTLNKKKKNFKTTKELETTENNI